MAGGAQKHSLTTGVTAEKVKLNFFESQSQVSLPEASLKHLQESRAESHLGWS